MKNVEKINKVLPNNFKYVSDNAANKALESKYNQQAVDFLIKAETTCEIVFMGLDKVGWGKTNVNKYEVTLKNKNHSYTFNFWDSISNTQKNNKATFDFYSVLASLELYTQENFDDFCAELGYGFKNETEYIKVKNIHLACLDQEKNLKKLFNQEQLNELAEIR